MAQIIGFGKTKKIVEYFLINNERSRNDDKYLTLLVWKYLLKKDVIELEEIFNLPSQDNIKRIRARFNQVGLYVATDEKVKQRRQRYQEVVKESLGY